MSDSDTMYERIARHLDPADPATGARTLDAEIIRQSRGRANAWNRHRLALYASPMLMALAMLFAIVPVFPDHERLLMLSVLPWLVQPKSVILIMAIPGLILFWFTLNRSDEPRRLPPLSVTVADALAAHNKRPEYLVYWAELYWHPAKLAAHRKRWFGFEVWRDTPRMVRDDDAAAAMGGNRNSANEA